MALLAIILDHSPAAISLGVFPILEDSHHDFSSLTRRCQNRRLIPDFELFSVLFPLSHHVVAENLIFRLLEHYRSLGLELVHMLVSRVALATSPMVRCH